MKLTYNVIIIALILLLSVSCTTKKISPYYQAPHVFRFMFKDSLGIGKITNPHDTDISIFYSFDNKKNYIDDFLVYENPDTPNQYQFSTRDIATISSNQQVKNFTIEFADGQTGNLYVDVERIDNGGDDACMCRFPYREVRYNGKKIEPYKDLQGYDVYVFEK